MAQQHSVLLTAVEMPALNFADARTNTLMKFLARSVQKPVSDRQVQRLCLRDFIRLKKIACDKELDRMFFSI